MNNESREDHGSSWGDLEARWMDNRDHFETHIATQAEAVREYTHNVADEDPALCRCRGCGWILSPYDTWESCPLHSGPHPEDHDHYEGDPEWTNWATYFAIIQGSSEDAEAFSPYDIGREWNANNVNRYGDIL